MENIFRFKIVFPVSIISTILQLNTLLEIALLLLRVWYDSSCAGFPVSGTHFTMGIGILEGLDQS